MSFYELSTLTFSVGSKNDRLDGLDEYLSQDDAELIGVFNSEISRQNLSLVIRRFNNLEALALARKRALVSDAPFGCDERLLGISLEAYAPFPGFEHIELGVRGPYYEFRTYLIPPGGLAPTLQAWTDIMPSRSQVSKPTLIIYALDGRPRFIHVWGYPTMAERERLRQEALDRRVWPPSSAPKWLTTDMYSEIFSPDRRSPLT